jgi:hypothetical protein
MSVAAVRLVALVAVAGTLSVGAAAQGTPEQRAACQGDAERLCSQYIPDVERITACMKQNRRSLSPRCRVFFERVGRTRSGRD